MNRLIVALHLRAGGSGERSEGGSMGALSLRRPRGGQMVAIDRLQEPASQTGRQLVDCKQLHTLCAGKRCLRPAMAPSVAVRDDNGAAQRSLLIESGS
jgi:hypothetical protein